MIVRPYREWTPKIDPSAFVADNAAVIGNVEIGPRCGIWYGVTVRGDVHEIRIGAETNMLELYVVASDKDHQAVLVARLDNLGKGASGAAVQNLSLMLGLDRA